MRKTLRRVLTGTPIATEHSEDEKVGIFGGMAVFAADAMSSVAYGPEEVLLVLVAAGAMGLPYALPVCIALAVLIWVVATSYRQTVVEYPSGGGAYVVARENLGTVPSQIAGGALPTDYALTVAAGGEAEPRLKRLWGDWEEDLPLVIIPAPYRDLTEPLLDYIRTARCGCSFSCTRCREWWH